MRVDFVLDELVPEVAGFQSLSFTAVSLFIASGIFITGVIGSSHSRETGGEQKYGVQEHINRLCSNGLVLFFL